jgi:WD40 repeat protein
MENLRIWNARFGGLTLAMVNPRKFTSVVLNPDGTRFAVARYNGNSTEVEIWPVNAMAAAQGNATNNGPVRLAGHDQDINALAFSPDGTLIATASDDGTVWIWDTKTGQSLTVLRSHDQPVLSVGFSPDGLRVITASGDGRIRVHPLRTADLLGIAVCRVGRNLTSEELNRFEVPTKLHLDLSGYACLP